MSNLKHTPGPWTWSIQDYSEAVLHGEDELYDMVMVISPCDSCIQRAQKEEKEPKWKWGRCGTPNIQDAHLIATAPEMLEALINLVKQLDDLGGDGLTLENEMKFTHYAGIIERATGLPIEEVLK